MNKTIEVIIATRNKPITECYEGLNINTPPITKTTIIKDEGQGQTKIRYSGALNSKCKYVLLLDDDVFLRPGLVKKYLDKIEEGYDGVCGNTNPKPSGPFGKYVHKFMTNPKTPFYAVGCTLWKREKFLEIMDKVGVNVTNFIGENAISKEVVKGKYRVVRIEDAVCDHMTYYTAKIFFKKNIGYGVANAELFFKEKRFLKMYLKFLVGIPLSSGRGIFVYRVAVFLGLNKYLINNMKK